MGLDAGEIFTNAISVVKTIEKAIDMYAAQPADLSPLRKKAAVIKAILPEAIDEAIQIVEDAKD